MKVVYSLHESPNYTLPQVADNQLAVQIRGECAVPRIALNVPVLEFGECFVRYPYK